MKNVADIYPLTPVQSGMLFHTLAHQRTGVYVNQFTCQLHGEVQSDLLQQAWQQTMERHPVLRTAVLWEGLDDPLQVVREVVKLPWQQLDWRDLSAAEREQQLSDFLQSDRTQGFDLAKAPIFRLALIRLTDDTYQFIWSNHHLLYDGWSLLLIWQDVLTLYSGLVQGSESKLAAVRPFRDFIAWQQQQDASSAESFWRQQLKGVSAPTPLPAANSTHMASGKPYRQQSKQLSAELTSQLSQFARQHRLTMNTLVQGAWALLLSHYSDGVDSSEPTANGQSVNDNTHQVTYGSVVSGRPAALSGVENMVGLFINTLPVTVQIESEQALIPWLQARQQQLLDLRQYESTPLADIQRWSELPAGSPLFESIVAFENITAAAPPRLSFDITDLQYLEQSNYPLALLIFPSEELDCRLLYDVDRFESGAIAQLLAHLEQLLAAFVTQPMATLAELPRLTPAEEAQRSPWPQADDLSEPDYPRDVCIHQLIEAQVEKTPEAKAVAFGEASHTYTELDQQATQLAAVLQAFGVKPGDRVALCLHRSLEMVVSILAVLKTGAAYVPLDPTYPESRISYCLQDTAPQLLITQRLIPLTITDVPCLYVDDDNFAVQVPPVSDSLAQPQDLAYIIYTSGSTGQPKGVMVSHRNLVHSTTARFTVYEEPVGRFLLLSSIAFDSSIAGIFWTLCQGGTLVVAPRRIEQDLQQLAGLIAKQKITHTLCVPTLYNLLLGISDISQLATLETVIVAGEACSRSLAQQHYRLLPHATLFNEYGPTEATVWCTAYRVPAKLSPGAIPIGSAIPNTQIHLLTPTLQPVPLGAIGEIYIGGEGITQGYLNQPEKTAAAFGDNNLYKTGDLGRYRADGTLEWLGRCDRQVKIRGYRIELGEIEDTRRGQTYVQEAVVVAQSSPTRPTAPELDASVGASVESLVAALSALPVEAADALLLATEEGN